MPHEVHRHHIPEPDHHSERAKKLAGITSRLQNIMLTENITTNELVGCARIVRKNHQRYEDMKKNNQGKQTDNENESKENFCSFCGKSSLSVRHTVVSPGACICSECIEVCEDLMSGFKVDC